MITDSEMAMGGAGKRLVVLAAGVALTTVVIGAHERGKLKAEVHAAQVAQALAEERAMEAEFRVEQAEAEAASCGTLTESTVP